MKWLRGTNTKLHRDESKDSGMCMKSFWQLLWLNHLPEKQRPMWRTVMVLSVVVAGVALGTQLVLLAPPDVNLPEVTWKIYDESTGPTLKKEIANKQIEELISEMKSTSEGGPPAAIKGGEKLATLYFDSGQYIDASKFSISSVRLREETAPNDKAGIARDYIRIGDCNYLLKDYPRAIENYMYGISLLKRNSMTITGLARACYRLAIAYEDNSEYERAENYYRQAIEYYNDGIDGSVTEKRAERALVMSRMAQAKAFQYYMSKKDATDHQEIKRMEKNVSAAKEKMRSLEKQRLSSNSKEIQEVQQELNTSEIALREAQTKALEYYQQAVASYKAAMKEWFGLGDYTNYAVTSYHLAGLHEEQGNYDEAAECYKHCLDNFPRVLSSEDDPYIAATAEGYSRVLWKQHKWMEWFNTKLRANRVKRAYKRKIESAAKSS